MRSLIRDFACRLNIMSVKLLTEHHLEFLSLVQGYKGSSESTHVTTPHRWKSHVTAHFNFLTWSGGNSVSLAGMDPTVSFVHGVNLPSVTKT